MSESPKTSELDAIVTLEEVREYLGEDSANISEKDLELVRSQAAGVLSKISDLSVRERSIPGVVKSRWKHLSSPNRLLVAKAAYDRAKKLFLQLNAGRPDMEFHGENFIRDSLYLRGRLSSLVGADKDLSVAEAFNVIARRFEKLIERFGSKPIGQQVFTTGAKNPGSIICASISSIDRLAHLHLTGLPGAHNPRNICASLAEAKEKWPDFTIATSS